MQMRLITDYLETIADWFPNKIAYIDSKREITFKQLQTEALKIAGVLVSNERKKDSQYFTATNNNY